MFLVRTRVLLRWMWVCIPLSLRPDSLTRGELDLCIPNTQVDKSVSGLNVHTTDLASFSFQQSSGFFDLFNRDVNYMFVSPDTMPDSSSTT